MLEQNNNNHYLLFLKTCDKNQLDWQTHSKEKLQWEFKRAGTNPSPHREGFRSILILFFKHMFNCRHRPREHYSSQPLFVM